MQTWIRSHLASAVAGGLVVAGAFMVLGVTGTRSTQTVVEQAPLIARPTASTSSQMLTAHSIYLRNAGGIVYVRAADAHGGAVSTGSGFLADAQGDIFTSSRIVASASSVDVEFADEVMRRAAIVAQDPDDGIAVLHVDTSTVPSAAPLRIGRSATVRVGDPVLLLGDPAGFDRTLTSGIVSALQQQITTPSGSSIDNVIQTDAPVSPGSEGGPLLDAYGRVIGITGFGGAISYAIPIDTAETVLQRLR